MTLNFKLIGDGSLRQDLANPAKGAALVARAVMYFEEITSLPDEGITEGAEAVVAGSPFRFDDGGWVPTDEVNIEAFGAVAGGDCTQPILDAAVSGWKVVFPKGDWLVTSDEIDLAVGTQFRGLSEKESRITHPGGESRYLFRLNAHTGITNLTVRHLSDYHGASILYDTAFASLSGGYGSDIAIDRVTSTRPLTSGSGAGLEILSDNSEPHNFTNVVYLNISKFHARGANACLRIRFKQTGLVADPGWMTACTFGDFISHDCVHALDFEMDNQSGTQFRDVKDINFRRLEVQGKPAGYFTTTTEGTLPLRVIGQMTRYSLPELTFSELSIWDIPSGVSGYVENAIIKLQTEPFLGFDYHRAPNYTRGIQMGSEGYVRNSRLIDLTALVDNGTTTSRLSFNKDSLDIYSNVDAPGGYNAKVSIAHQLPDGGGASDSSLNLSVTEQNGEAVASLVCGHGAKSFLGNQGGFANMDVMFRDGSRKHLLNFGSEGMIYNAIAEDKGFYSGNGVYIKYTRHTSVSVPSGGLHTFDLPIPVGTFSYIPFLVSCVVGSASPDVLVHVARAHVTGINTVRVTLSQVSGGAASVVLHTVTAGYRQMVMT